jgi:hypothetical protein
VDSWACLSAEGLYPAKVTNGILPLTVAFPQPLRACESTIALLSLWDSSSIDLAPLTRGFLFAAGTARHDAP